MLVTTPQCVKFQVSYSYLTSATASEIMFLVAYELYNFPVPLHETQNGQPVALDDGIKFATKGKFSSGALSTTLVISKTKNALNRSLTLLLKRLP